MNRDTKTKHPAVFETFVSPLAFPSGHPAGEVSAE
jgi:hypothetical protein